MLTSLLVETLLGVLMEIIRFPNLLRVIFGSPGSMRYPGRNSCAINYDMLALHASLAGLRPPHLTPKIQTPQIQT